MGEKKYAMTFQDGTQRSNASSMLTKMGACVFPPEDVLRRKNPLPSDEIILIFIVDENEGQRLFPSKHLRVLKSRAEAVEHGFMVPSHFDGIPDGTEAQVIIIRACSAKSVELGEALKSTHNRDIATQKWKLPKKKSPSRIAHSGKYHRHQQRALC